MLVATIIASGAALDEDVENGAAPAVDIIADEEYQPSPRLSSPLRRHGIFHATNPQQFGDKREAVPVVSLLQRQVNTR